MTGSTVSIVGADGISTSGSGSTLTISSTGIQTITADEGSSAIGPSVEFTSPQGTPKFSASGSTVTLDFSDSGNNVGIGSNALLDNTGTGNTGIGTLSLELLTTGIDNTALGLGSGQRLRTGSDNVLIGFHAGFNYIGAESNNIVIGAGTLGTTSESNVIHIGDTGASAATTCFIGGIFGVTTTAGGAIPVLVNSVGQLGTVSSSKRFKENINDMEDSYSVRMYQLQPKKFYYKQDATKTETWGLIAEQVQEVFPELVVSDKEGMPITVRYHDLPVLLLNEAIKQKKEMESYKKELAHLKCLVEHLSNGK